MPVGVMLLILVPFLIAGQYFQNRKYSALLANPEHTSTVISNIGYIHNDGPIIHYIITVNGRGDTAVLGLQDYYQMKSELELLRALSEAENDVVNERVAPIQNTFDNIRKSLLERGSDDV